jgi:membrane glycosyltransferase
VPEEIAATMRHVREAPAPPGFAEAVINPTLNALVAGLGTARPLLPDRAREQRLTLVERALSDGPEALSAPEKGLLLRDPIALSKLHERVWTQPRAHPFWRALRVAAGTRA